MLWRSVGAAPAWIPELEGGPTKLPLPSPPQDARDPVLLTALLCREPAAILRRLKASNAEIDRAAAIEKGPERPGATDQRSVRHWLAHAGSAADDLSSLWALRNGTEPPWLPAVREIRGRRDPLTRSDLAITGADLQAMGLRGPQIGQVLGKLLDRVLDEPHLNTHDALLTLARQLA